MGWIVKTRIGWGLLKEGSGCRGLGGLSAKGREKLLEVLTNQCQDGKVDDEQGAGEPLLAERLGLM
jgi:hypothetical protein